MNIVFGIIVVVGIVLGVFIWRHGFVSSWVNLFNTLLSIYLGVMLGPVIMFYSKPVAGNAYFLALFVFGVFLLCYILTSKIADRYFSDAFTMPMPVVIDRVVAVFPALLTGFCVVGFMLFVFGITPASGHRVVKKCLGDFASADKVVVFACGAMGELSCQYKPAEVAKEVIVKLNDVKPDPSDTDEDELKESGRSRESDVIVTDSVQ